MTKMRRSALWLTVVIAAGIVLTPQRGAARTDPYRYYIPEEIPQQIGDPDGGGSGISTRAPIEFGSASWFMHYVATKFVLHLSGVRTWATPSTTAARAQQ
jgi:hypothetical protein